MGVAGCGKSSLGQACAQLLGVPLLEGDDFHSPSNINKMRSGTPLTDTDRSDWLARLGAELQAHPQGVVLTCSALRQRYRDQLRAAAPGLRFAFLELSPEAARERVAARPGHVFPVSLVGSQFATLEDPRAEAGVLALDATRPVPDLAAAVARWMAEAATSPLATEDAP